MKDTIIEFMEDIVDADNGTIHLEDKLEDLEDWDSVNLLRLLMFLDRDCGLEVDIDRLVQCATVAEIVSEVEACANTAAFAKAG